MSYHRGGDLGSLVLGIFFYGWICVFITGWMLRHIFGIDRPTDFLFLSTSLVVFLAFPGALWGLVKVYAWREKWKPCIHGVSGGKDFGRCQQCLAEIEAAEGRRRTAEEERLRRELIKSRAVELRQQEIERLSHSIVPSLEELRQLTPQRFENEIANLFRRLGYHVKQTPYSNDMGRDAIMMKGGEKYLLECKRYGRDNQSGRPDIQKFHSAIISDRAKGGFFVTSGSFSKAALDFAPSVSIELVDGNRIVRMFTEINLSTVSDDSYESICIQCGATVRHRLRAPQAVTCLNGHSVSPTLTFDQILGVAPDATPICAKCGSLMRTVQGRNGKFWGCSRYPACRHTRPFGRHAYSRGQARH